MTEEQKKVDKLDYLTPEGQYELLMLPPPDNQGPSWANFSKLAKLVKPELCLKVLREPEPYLTNVHRVALMVLGQHDWTAISITSDGSDYFEYKVKDQLKWHRILKPYPRYKSGAVREIIDRLLSNETVYVKYENDDNKLEWKDGTPIHIYTRNALKLVPTGFRRFKRFWRNASNNDWFILGPADMNCDVETISSDVHTGIFINENDAIIFVTQWLMRARERDAEQKRLEQIFHSRYEGDGY